MASNDALVKAIEDNNFGAFLTLKHKVQDINARAQNGMTPLIATIVYDRVGMFIALKHDKSIDTTATDKDGFDPMYHAVCKKRLVYRLGL